MNDQAGEDAASPGPTGAGTFLIVAGCLLLTGSLIFGDFIFGQKLLLYTDAGADSVNDTYPTYLHLSDYIRHSGMPSWSFGVGMGQNIFYLIGDLFWEPVVWLPRQLIASALVFQHLLKALVAGLLFFRFLQLRGLNLFGSLGGALCLAFSAHMCMGSCWMISAEDTVCFTLVLFAAETAIVRRHWVYLPIAVALSGLITVFHLYLSAALLCLYVPARLIELYRWKPSALFGVCLRLAGFALLGVGLGAVVLLGSSYAILHSPRASGAVANFSFGPAPGIFQPGSSLYYITNLLRLFSSDMIGAGDSYRGFANYYEGPLGYCGLLSLLILPQAFAGTSRRQRIIYIAFLAAIAIPIVFPWFRYLFWLFKGGYFRTFSLFSVFAVLVMSMTALSRFSQGMAINFRALGAALCVLLGILYWPGSQLQSLINHQLIGAVTMFLIAYAAILAIGQVMKRQKIATALVLVVTAIELVYFSRITVNRPTITKQEAGQRIGYNDWTVDAVRDIKQKENGFFRVTKTFGSSPGTFPSFNDALVFNYYGTPSYSSFNNSNYVNFLLAVGAIDPTHVESEAQWSPGLIGHPLLLTFACEKYVITENPVPLQTVAEYQFVRQYDGVHVFRNNFFLPFGLVFTRYIPETIFRGLPAGTKERALLQGVVLSDDDAGKSLGVEGLSQDQIEHSLLDTPMADTFAERRKTAFRTESFHPTRITGTVRLDRNAVVVFQMPFDAGWRCLANGRSVPTMKADIGLLGVALPAGEQKLQLKFNPPLLFAGAVASLVSLIIFLFSLRRWPQPSMLSLK